MVSEHRRPWTSRSADALRALFFFNYRYGSHFLIRFSDQLSYFNIIKRKQSQGFVSVF